MKDVSSVFDHFRVSAREIWNRAFWPVPDFQNWDSEEAFGEIKTILFEELVLERLSVDWPRDKIFRDAIPFFSLAPTLDLVVRLSNARHQSTAIGIIR